MPGMKPDRTVLAFGTFDLLHPGHEFFLRFAKQQGTRLIVVIGRDSTVERLKGRPPIHREDERKAAVEALRIADEVVLGDQNDHLRAIRETRPDTIVLGYDQTHFTDRLRTDLDSLGLTGTEILRAPAHDPERWKSSKLREKLTLSESPEDTRHLAKDLAAVARAGDVYLLTGEMGAGKTAFVQGFLAAMGITEGVTSPTYVYETRHPTALFPVYHLDLYRVDNIERLHALGLEERLSDPGNVLLVEWPEILEAHFPLPPTRHVVRIAISVEGELRREIRVTTDGAEGKEKPSETRQEI